MDPHRTTSRAARAMAVLAVAFAVVAAVAGCTSTPAPSADAFCRRLAANQVALAGPGSDPTAVAATLAAYRKVGEVAPVAVRDAWVTVTALLQSAVDTDLAQPGAADKLAARALAAKPEIDSITAYTKATCELDLVSGLPTPTAAPSPAPAAAPPATDATGAPVETTEPPGTLPAASGAGGSTSSAPATSAAG